MRFLQLIETVFFIAILSLIANAQTGGQPIKTQTFSVGAETDHVNVMGDAMPTMPAFPAIAKKAGYVRGYVKDSLGQPIAGAKLGLKSARFYDSYLAATTESDASGYYEIKIPTGGARFDFAGFTIKYGRGMAALGLHPADGDLNESYPAASGAVENFVMLPYGIGDVEGASKSPRYRGNYYGGTMLIRYFIAPPGQDVADFAGMLSPGSEVAIELNPVGVLADRGTFARGFQIRKRVENSSLGEFYICNVPVGRYDIVVRQANGKPLRMRQKNPTGSVYGIQPAETSGVASLIFNPLSPDAKTATASRGNWTDLEIIVERP
ncbi:MAG: carboxypeptidase-like regulatory domain-containing protein [Pyrinomonadaceae bacterium]